MNVGSDIQLLDQTVKELKILFNFVEDMTQVILLNVYSVMKIISWQLILDLASQTLKKDIVHNTLLLSVLNVAVELSAIKMLIWITLDPLFKQIIAQPSIICSLTI